MVIEIDTDHTAGIDLPNTYTLTMQITGAQGAGFRALVDEGDPEVKKQMMTQISNGAGGSSRATSIDMFYDDEAATAKIVVKGVGEPMFDFNEGEMQLALNGAADNASFTPNRVRPKWRNIPVATGGPSRSQTIMRVDLPDQGAGFTLRGTEQLDGSYAHTRYFRSSKLSGSSITLDETNVSKLGEITLGQLAEARRAALQISKSDLMLIAPETAKRRWDFTTAELKQRTAPALAGYNIAIEQADDDDFGPLRSRAEYFSLIYDFENAVKDFSAIIDEEPNASLFRTRADLLLSLGRMDEAIADTQAAYELQPTNWTGYWQAELLARSGKTDEALKLLELIPVSEDEIDGKVDSQSIVLGLAGRVNEGLKLLADRLEERPDSATALSADCLLRGLHAVALEGAIAQCNRAVERANNTASRLFARALVHYRKGDTEKAFADLDAAQKLSPAYAENRYLRGIIMLEQGDEDGRTLVETALRQLPELRNLYALYGIEPTG